MATVEFAVQSSRDPDNIAANPERLLNIYAEPVTRGGKAGHALKSVLGSEVFSRVESVFLRALKSVDGVLYAVTGGILYAFDAVGNETNIGSVSDDINTSMAGIYGDVAIVCGGNYYVLTGGSVTTPTAGAFSSFGSVCFVGGYTVMTELGGARFQWSDLADPSTLPGLNFATAESRDDDLIRCVGLNGNLWLFGERSIEIWFPSGGSGANAFTKVSGGVIETGLMAFGLVTTFPNGAFFVGDDGIVYITSGSGLQPVSTPAVETAISSGAPTHCFFYEDEGHKFCILRFSDRPAWCYDISTGLWHERSTGQDAWEAVDCTKHAGSYYFGGDSGTIYRLARTYFDSDDFLYREIVSKTLYLGGKRFNIPELEVLARVGRTGVSDTYQNVLSDSDGDEITNEYGDLISVDGVTSDMREPAIMLDISGDGGMTYGPERRLSLGAIGEYETRLLARRLGRYRQATMRLRMTDDVNVSIYSAANVRVT